MEKDYAKSADKEAKEVLLKVDSYAVSVKLVGDKLQFKANSDTLGKLFVGSFAESNMTDFQKEYLGNCAGVFQLIEQCVSEKRAVELSDIGQLKFMYLMKLSRKNEVSKTLLFELKEVEISEMERLTMRVDRLERQNIELRNKIEKLGVGSEFQKIPGTIDLSIPTANNFTINGQEVSSNKGAGNWYPIFLQTRLNGKKYFEMEIAGIVNNGIMIGVGAESMKVATPNNYSNVDSLILYPAGSVLYYSGTSKSAPHSWTTSDRITVKVDLIRNSVEWEQSYPLFKSIIKCAIPQPLLAKNLYPVIFMLETYNDRVRFI